LARCPECGGEMIPRMKRKVCETCGLSLSGVEYDKAWDKVRRESRDDDSEKDKKNREYRDWLLKKKDLD
jgi:ribosomal protein L37AE/L43A